MKCEYCGKRISKTKEKCPYCNSINKNYERVVNSNPKTIEELKEWYEDRNLPPEKVTRFFIGTDYKKPRAFGIYKDNLTGEFVVYKNKDTGERKIRYQGTDEAYAVNELYTRLKNEIASQKRMNTIRRNKRNENIRAISQIIFFTGGSLVLIYLFYILFGLFKNCGVEYTLSCIMFFELFGLTYLFVMDAIIDISDKLKDAFKALKYIGIVFMFGVLLLFGFAYHDSGYYHINNSYYYKNGNNWYKYSDTSGEWRSSYKPIYSGDLSDYTDEYDADSPYSDVHDSDAWEVDHSTSSSSSSSSHSDSDYDWDSGSSWDSGSTDWSSDW